MFAAPEGEVEAELFVEQNDADGSEAKVGEDTEAELGDVAACGLRNEEFALGVRLRAVLDRGLAPDTMVDDREVRGVATAEEDMSGAPRFDEVAEQLSGPLQRYLQRFVGEPHAAEDLLQETLLRISKGLPGFEGRSSLKTWAFSIATRTAIDHLRSIKDSTRIAEVDVEESLSGIDQEVGERLVIDEMNTCIREEIDSLPGDYRAAILLHDLEGLTAAETAEISGCSLATAKIRIHRARARLRQALKKDCTFYHDRDQTLRCDRKPRGPDAGPSE